MLTKSFEVGVAHHANTTLSRRVEWRRLGTTPSHEEWNGVAQVQRRPMKSGTASLGHDSGTTRV